MELSPINYPIKSTELITQFVMQAKNLAHFHRKNIFFQAIFLG